MSILLKLCPTIRDYIIELNNSGLARSLETSIGIARAICDTLSVPSGPVDSPEMFMLQTYQSYINDDLNTINDVVPIDFDRIKQLITVFYTMRYNVAFAKGVRAAYRDPKYAVADFFGVGGSLSDELVCALETNGRRITDTAVRFGMFFDELKEPVDGTQQ